VNSQQPFAGRTLPQLLEGLDNGAKLLVVVNAPQSGVSVAQQAVADALGARGHVVGWRDVGDDPCLGTALSALLDSAGEQT
jgi:predicted phosphoribosyltransferase